MAEWSNELARGACPQGRGSEPYRCHAPSARDISARGAVHRRAAISWRRPPAPTRNACKGGRGDSTKRTDQTRGNIVVSISARHAEDPGSIPGRGAFCHIQTVMSTHGEHTLKRRRGSRTDYAAHAPITPIAGGETNAHDGPTSQFSGPMLDQHGICDPALQFCEEPASATPRRFSRLRRLQSSCRMSPHVVHG